MRHLGIPSLGLSCLAGAPASQAATGDYAAKRAAMVGEIRAMSRESGTGALSAHVLEAMGRAPRHEFVPPELSRSHTPTVLSRSGTDRRSASRTSSR